MELVLVEEKQTLESTTVQDLNVNAETRGALMVV